MKKNIRNRFIGIALLYGISLALFISCEKHVTPDKVTRKITQDSWRISSFNFMDSLVTIDYADHGFSFSDGGNIIVSDAVGVSGSWSVGLNKKPTILYLSGFQTAPFNRLNDDWEVEMCNSDQITLRGGNNSVVNNLTLTKIK